MTAAALGAMGQMGSSGTEATSSALGMYAGYRIGKASDKAAFERQKWMAGHAHQLEVQDLREAGLNPILSAGGSGANFPGASNTASGTAMQGADTGAKIGRSVGDRLSQLNMEELRERIKVTRATAAREEAAKKEIEERTRAEYGVSKKVGAVVDAKTGKVLDPGYTVSTPGRVTAERDRLQLQNALLGVDAAKSARMLEILKNKPELLDAWLFMDAAKDVSNSARSVTGLVTDFIPGNKGGK